MTQSQSEKFISILIHMKKHPEMLIDKPCMSYLDAFQLGFVMGCNSSDVEPTNERSELQTVYICGTFCRSKW